jgi:A/G-specific adenine glycosylase
VAPPQSAVRLFQRRLLAWYARHGRDLPWRRTRVPYRVLVSEIMLQQTQVERVIPKYRQFLRAYPTLRALAAADVDDVRRLWYPLGYNVRPVRLHAIARETVARYGGFLGPRRFARLRGDRRLWALAEALVPRGRGYDFNQALMDFGATWCTARRPRCTPCPLRRLCATFPTSASGGAQA